ncbi:hypothetical protein LCGC14_0864730 [marine sediment metagenome]|uniref:Uncharacterized protein n=1 Tax=marine sediment metagenome TaxID=412755 RepID=A0A0F9RR08_9ZZZZ
MAREDLSEIQKAILEFLNEDPEEQGSERILLKEVLGMSHSDVVNDIGLEELRTLSQAGHIVRSRRLGETHWQITPTGQRVIDK